MKRKGSRVLRSSRAGYLRARCLQIITKVMPLLLLLARRKPDKRAGGA